MEPDRECSAWAIVSLQGNAPQKFQWTFHYLIELPIPLILLSGLSLRFSNRNHSTKRATHYKLNHFKLLQGALVAPCVICQSLMTWEGKRKRWVLSEFFQRSIECTMKICYIELRAVPYKEPRLANVGNDLKAGSRTDETFSRHQMFETMTKRSPRQSLQHTTMSTIGKVYLTMQWQR